jgi:cytochrome P450 / NADPH-cytochrome P450 reductase
VDVGINDDELLTQAQVSNLIYNEQVIKETLRLHSPLRDLNKCCTKDIILPGRYLIREGDLTSVNLNNLHRNPKIW